MLKLITNVGLQALLKLFFSIASLKVVAYYAGPSGMAALGQLQAFLSIASAGASSVTTTGVVKHISEKKHQERSIITVSLLLLIVFSLILFLFFAGGAVFIAESLFGGAWIPVFILLPLAAFFVGVSNLFISYYNGHQRYNRYFYYSIISSFLMAATTIVMTMFYGLNGAIYSIVVSPVLVGVILIAVFKEFNVSSFNFSFIRDWPLAKSLLHFSYMAIGSAVVVYGGHIYLRDFISTNVSVDASGIWYSATRLSEIYMGIASVLFSTILLPRYSSRFDRQLKGEVVRMFGLAAFFVVAMVFSVKLCSGVLVDIIYGEAFKGASDIIDLYVFGDALKVLTWVFLYVAIAKQKVLFYLVYEIFSAICYVLFSVLVYHFFDFTYVPFGYVAQSAVSLCVVIVWFVCSYRCKGLIY